MKITDEQINQAANEYEFGYSSMHNSAFQDGAHWAINQMQDKWISVEERLPDDKQDVWVCNVIKGWGPALFYFDENENLFIKDYWCQFKPENTTHWMVADLPDLPNRNNN